VGLRYMLLPALLVHINSTFGAVVNMSSGFLATDRTFHDSLPPLPFFFNSSGLTPLPFSSLESVT
jgi:hypothetical protein